MTDLSTADVKAPAEPSSSESQSPPKRKDTDPFADWDSYRTSKIEIKVDKPILREELFAKYYVYKIQGTDLKGYFEVSRRYSDFEKVRQLLVARWPGCFVPSLPSKKINNMGKTVVEDRTKNLDAFCRRVADIPHLHYSDVYQVFLRTKMVDLDPILATYQKVRYDDIIDRYSKVFRHLAEKEVESDAIFKITAFAAFLKKSEAQFEKFKKVGKTFIEARKTFTQELANMHNMMSEDYEKNVFSEYHGRKNEKNVFFDALNPKPNEHIETVRDLQKQESVEKLYEWIKSEGRDILAFSEAFAQRDKYESLKGKAETRQRTDTKDLQNMSMGKTTLKTLFTKNDKKEETMAKMENKITSTAKDIENLGVVQELITAVMAYEEIDKFKANKVETYYEVVGQTAKHELKTFAAVQEYWAGMLENRNIKQLDV